MQIVATLVGGSVALSTHSTKMGVRLMAHTVPEPITHSVISIAEDVGVVSLAALAMTHPMIALPIVVVLLIVVFFLLRMAFRALAAAGRRAARWFSFGPNLRNQQP